MTVDQIIALALSNTHTKSGQISAANQIRFFNLSRNKVAGKIIKDVNENFFFQIWTIDAEDDTNADRANGEYLYPQVTSAQAGMKKLLRLAVKGYSTDTYHTPCTEVDITKLPKDWLWYMTNQPKSDPIYHISDESFFIAPKFKAADLPSSPSGNKQIKCYGVASLTDLVSGAAESTILVPKDFHETIALGMEKYIYKARGKKKEAFDSLAEFNSELEFMVDELTNRDESYMEATLPDDSHLE